MAIREVKGNLRFPFDFTYHGCPQNYLRKDFKNIFVVVSYELNNKILEIKTLNSYMVDEDLKTTKTLKQAFLKHKDDKNLFTNPVRFKQLNVKN